MADKKRFCSTCRAPIPEGADHYRCSVSSCNSGRMKLFFCSIACWQSHVPTARHRHASYVLVPGQPAEPTG